MDPNNLISCLDHFDDLFRGNPFDIEANLSALLPHAEKRSDKSIYLQILSQIALAQAMQKKFDEAHRTLDRAETLLEPHYRLAKIRILLERGRVFHQQGLTDKAMSFFIQSYDLSKLSLEYDFHSVNAAHMIAIVEENVVDKIKWNKIAIGLCKNSHNKDCRAWLGPIQNNLAQNYIEAGFYSDALQSFEKCKDYAEERGDSLVMRGASWGIARALRGLERFDQAFEIQNALLSEYKQISDENSLPIELIRIGRGLVYEELAELYCAKNITEYAQKYAKLAYEDLEKDLWMKRMYPERMQRLYALRG